MSASESVPLVQQFQHNKSSEPGNFKESEQSVNSFWWSPRTPIWVFTFLLISVLIVRVLMEVHVIGWGATIDNEYKYESLERQAEEHDMLKAIGRVWEDDEDWIAVGPTSPKLLHSARPCTPNRDCTIHFFAVVVGDCSISVVDKMARNFLLFQLWKDPIETESYSRNLCWEYNRKPCT
eukprot:967909-Pyramimonas_sp.AAC.2